MITREAILHIPKSNYSYGYDENTLHIRVRTKKNEVNKVSIKIGDPYIWEKGGADGGNLNAEDASGWSGSIILPMEKEAVTEYFDYWFISYQPTKKRSRYAFIIESDHLSLLYGERRIVELNENNKHVLNDIANFFCFPYLNSCDVHKIPSWVKDTVWYQIFPDRFCNGDKSTNPIDVKPWGTKPTHNNFMGGDLKGIIDQLDYLKNLGVNGLYLCPIFEAGTNHRYDTINYLAIDKLLGDKETFRVLVDEAHKRGIKIMLDAVFNHIGHQSKEWQDVVKNNELSKYKDWFCINKFPVYDKPFNELDGKNLNYETFGRVKSMPKVNTENPEVIDYFMKVGKYWIEEFNIDAWRIDVANEVDHNFWRSFRKSIKEVNEDVFLLGEIWHDAAPWLKGDQFDAAMNYPLTEAIIHYFCSKDIDKSRFIETVNNVIISYSRQVTENNFNLLDSHDTSRILSIAKDDIRKLKLVYLFMLTQPGSPCIYYGSEIPMKGIKSQGREDHRSCMTFDHTEEEFYNFMKTLIHIRHENPSFKTTNTKWINSSGLELIYKIDDIFVIMNNQESKSVCLLPEVLKKSQVKNLFTGEMISLGIELELEPYEYFILKT